MRPLLDPFPVDDLADLAQIHLRVALPSCGGRRRGYSAWGSSTQPLPGPHTPTPTAQPPTGPPSPSQPSADRMSPLAAVRAPGVPIPGFVMDTRDVPTMAPGQAWGTENAKKAGPDPSGGPAPDRHLLGSRTRPAIPCEGRLRQHDPCPGPVGTARTDRWRLRLLTSMQRDCDMSIPLWRRGRSLRGAVSGWVSRSWDDAGS